MIRLRRTWNQAGTVGMTLPVKLALAVGIRAGDYIEVQAADAKTITVRKHDVDHERGLRHVPKSNAKAREG